MIASKVIILAGLLVILRRKRRTRISNLQSTD
ncbi:MAG: hypothetical protein EHM25_04540 [Nitrosopumilales archaeon]|nr:MAG: hypothetical protein EHM25_04540 [Nitrosopumilales archaeon]